MMILAGGCVRYLGKVEGDWIIPPSLSECTGKNGRSRVKCKCAISKRDPTLAFPLVNTS